MRRSATKRLAALAVVAGANLTTQTASRSLLAHPRARQLLGADQLEWDGFPSGHATAAASIAIAFAFVVPARLLPAVAALGACLAAAMGWAVLVLNWHYPSDVVGGILVAGAWGFAVLAVDAGSRPASIPAGRLSWAGAPPSR